MSIEIETPEEQEFEKIIRGLNWEPIDAKQEADIDNTFDNLVESGATEAEAKKAIIDLMEKVPYSWQDSF